MGKKVLKKYWSIFNKNTDNAGASENTEALLVWHGSVLAREQINHLLCGG